MYAFYQKLIALRKNATCFTHGEYRLIALKNYYRFERRFQGESYHVIVCFAKPCRLPKVKGELVLNNYKTIGARLKPYQVLVYKKPSGK